MNRIIQQMKSRDEKGFTLIELLIVVAIIAILAAIAIPQFAAYRERAIEASMVSDARNAATAMEAVFADCQTYDVLAATGPGPVSAIVGAGAIGSCTAANLGVRVNISAGNTMTITNPTVTSYNIQVANVQVTTAPKTTPLTLIGGANTAVAPSCSFADGTNC